MTKKKGKTILNSIIAIVALLCAAIVVWFASIKFFAKVKNPELTFNVSEIELTDGTKKDVYIARYYANKDGSGREMFEINFNDFLDETRNKTYSQGLQFVTNSSEEKLNWDVLFNCKGKQTTATKIKKMDDETRRSLCYDLRDEIGHGNWYWATRKILHKTHQFAAFGQYGLTTGSTYNYASSNDYETVINSGEYDPLDGNTSLKISFKDKTGKDNIYKMAFKGDYIKFDHGDKTYDTYNSKKDKNTFTKLPEDISGKWRPAKKDFVKGSNNFIYSDDQKLQCKDSIVYTDYMQFFHTFDPYYIAYSIYSGISKATAFGTNEYITFKFADIFDYYECDSNNNYSYIGNDNVIKVKEEITTNISIKVEVFERGATKASDSLFNIIHDDPTFNISTEKVYDDYFFGTNIVELDIRDFEMVQVGLSNDYRLKMTDNAFNYYLPAKKKDVPLSICIDLDVFDRKGYNFLGFTSDSRLNEFKIEECYTLHTENGQVVRREVNYAS